MSDRIDTGKQWVDQLEPADQDPVLNRPPPHPKRHQLPPPDYPVLPPGQLSDLNIQWPSSRQALYFGG